MKNYFGLAPIAIIVLALTLILLPTSEAKRNDRGARQSSNAGWEPFPESSKLDNVLTLHQQEQGGAAQNQTQTMTVGWSVKNDESPALRDMKVLPAAPQEEEEEANLNPQLPYNHLDRPDPVIQAGFGDLQKLMGPAAVTAMPATILNFDGILFPGVACNCAPPDTDGEIGLTQYVQMVNEGFQVFNKATGASTFGPAGITTLWSGFGGICENNGNGDPVVMYDQLADRWVITQFAGVGNATDECIAVSKTGDATGAYYRYDFTLGTNFYDYPHLGVWPDGYYMSMNVFNAAGTAFLGPQAFAFDRSRMLAGLSASFLTPGITGGPSEDSFLPADLDGYSLPPAGAPNSFVEVPFTNTYRTWHFHVDFATPANATFTLFASPAAAGFTALCPGTRACVPQLGGTGANSLDGIGDRLMYRLAYRNIGGVESLIGNHTVNASAVAGIRWFELRGVTSGPETVFQESTYQPDTTWRWMGSAAMDNQGNLALGFSASSATINPQIRYAGRLSTDPVNSLAQGEATLFAGTGSQTGTNNRWGDYSAMSVDPSDDCTFWYTQEYYSATGAFNWRTRIGNFKYPICTTSARGTISGTITNCSTAAPIPNAQVSITGGYNRATDAAGTYSAIVTPATYNASVTAIGYDTASTTGLVVANGGNATFSACLNAVAPEIAVAGNGTVDIVDGDTTPTTIDGTQFGIANTAGGTVVHTFTIQNIGATNLTVGVPTTSGPNASDFSVTLAPTSPVTPGGSTTFQVTFDPSASGPRTATVTFANNDSDENPFNFDVAGTGTNGSAACPLAVLPNNGGTSGNERAPTTNFAFGRAVYLITAAELAAAGYTSGSSPTTIGWTYSTGGIAGSAPLIVYMQNTADTTNIKSTTWTTAISGMTVVHNATTALPSAAGSFDINLTGGSPFTYTGGGLYIAFDWGQYTGTRGSAVISCSTALTNGLLGAQSNVSAPTTTAASSFRPETRLNGNSTPNAQNDAAVTLIYSYGEIPFGQATLTVKALVTNAGAAALTNLPVTLNITGDQTFTDTQNIASLPACGGQTTVTFAPFNPSGVGFDTVTVSVPTDDIPGNNSLSKPLNVTFADYSYKYPGSADTGGVGLTGATGAFVGKFTVTSANSVKAVKLNFRSVTATTYKVAIYGDNGGVPSTTALYVDAADRTVSASGPVTITLPAPVAVPAGNFYVGLQQTNTTNCALSYDAETPIRSGSFFLASPNPPAAWSDFAPANSFKLNIGAIMGIPTAAPAAISGTITNSNGQPMAGVTVNLSGGRAARAITDSQGNYRFSNVDIDNFYTVTPSLMNYHFSPEERSFSLVANKTDAVFTAMPDGVIVGNVIDSPEYFVRQHYLDFLGREPDQGGFNYWSDQVLVCGSDLACADRRRINVSAAYFLSIEFQQTGGLVDSLYRASYGRRPSFAEFMVDRQSIAQNITVGVGDWPQQLLANKQAFVDAWLQRAEFRAAYDGLSNSAFVDALIGHAGSGFNGDRSALVSALDGGNSTRAAVVLQIAENEGFVRAKSNEMFVMMEYFGYLRRDPDEDGYRFWLNKLNQFGGNFEQAEMVKAFISSSEYRQRFAQ